MRRTCPSVLPERRRQQPHSRGSSYQRERRQGDFHGPGRGSLAYNHIELIIFHGWIERLFYHSVQAMDLIDEEDVPRFQARQDGRQVPGPFQHRARRSLDIHPKLGGDDIGQLRFS